MRNLVYTHWLSDKPQVLMVISEETAFSHGEPHVLLLFREPSYVDSRTLFRPYSGSKQRGDARANASFQLRAAPGMRCYPDRVTGAPVLSARAAEARMPW